MHPYYPVFLNVEGRKCVVIGGGEVALRKVKVLVEHRAKVKVVSPVLCPELSRMAEEGLITVNRRAYNPDDLHNSFVVIAAASGDINHMVAREARRRRILVNVVDDPALSDFIVPAHLQRGDLTVAVSTSGKSPALARKIRTRLEQHFTAEYADLTDIIEEVRSELKAKGIKISNDDWQRALDLDFLLGLLREGKRDKVKTALLRNLTEKGNLAIRYSTDED